MAIIDRYLLGAIAWRYAAIVIGIVFVLILEGLPRLAVAVEHVRTPIPLLGGLVGALVPEYLAIANPIALYLAIAWVVRSLHLRGEWQIFGTIGMRSMRVMSVPLALALAATGWQVIVRGELQPNAEQRLDELLSGIQSGAFGIDIPLGQVVQLADDTDFFAERGRGGQTSILIRRGADVMTADGASIGRDADGSMSIMLRDGQMTQGVGSVEPRSVTFARLSLRLDNSRTAPPVAFAAERMDRRTIDDLRQIVAEEARSTGAAPATSALLARLQNALFCLVLPWLALTLAVPPRRHPGGAGMLLGLLIIVGNLRSTALIEQVYAATPWDAALLHMLAWTLFTVAIVRLGGATEPGTIDRWISSLPARLASLRWLTKSVESVKYERNLD